MLDHRERKGRYPRYKEIVVIVDRHEEVEGSEGGEGTTEVSIEIETKRSFAKQR